MKIRWFAIIQLLAACVFSNAAFADSRGDAVLGVWYTPDSDSQVEIYHCAKNNYCGKVTWLKVPNFPLDDDNSYAGKLKVDRYNPDENKQNDPVVGKEILQGLFYSEDSLWHDGEIYDPKNGKTYQCKATMTSDGKLEIRGFIGISLIGRTSVWTRRSS